MITKYFTFVFEEFKGCGLDELAVRVCCSCGTKWGTCGSESHVGVLVGYLKITKD